MVHKIAIVGPESTGKTTLSQQLAEHYRTVWVEEFARYYLECLPRAYVPEDLTYIGKGQLAWELVGKKLANHLLICDTNLLVIDIWSRYKYGQVNTWIRQNMNLSSYKLHLLLYIDADWEEDPLREHPDIKSRQELFGLYEESLRAASVPYQIIRGQGQERIDAAILAIDQKVSSLT